MNKIATAFVKAKKTFSPALKDKTNPAFRSKYADLGACLEAVNDALLENGIALTQRSLIDETGITIETILLHESGEFIASGPLHVPATKMDAQGFGSAMTYARRYSLMAVCGIAPEDDDGNAASKPAKAFKSVAQTVLDDAPAIEAKRKEYIDGFGEDIVREFQENGVTGLSLVKAIDAEKLNDIEKIYLWNNLPSPMRTAIKSAGSAAKTAVPA